MEVTRWYPSPLRCRNCFNFRHHESFCQQMPKCPKCNRTCVKDDPNHQCDRVYCIGCDTKGDHVTFDKNCPAFAKEKEIVKMQVDLNISRYEARQKWYETYRVSSINKDKVSVDINKRNSNNPSVVPSVSYSQIVKSPSRPTSTTTKQNTTPTRQNDKTHDSTANKDTPHTLNIPTNLKKQRTEKTTVNKSKNQTVKNKATNKNKTTTKNSHTINTNPTTNKNKEEVDMDVVIDAQLTAASNTPLPTSANLSDLDGDISAYFDTITDHEDNTASSEESV